MLKAFIGIAFLSLIALPVPAQINQQPSPAVDNAELTLLFKEDQRVRVAKPLGPNEPKITRKDSNRESLVKEMLAHNLVITKGDNFHAAVILQHSRNAADILVAHMLAVLCASDGDQTCLRFSALTLDRYLQYINEPQIFGTQYTHFDHPPVTQQPYADDVITDSMRSRFGIPTLEEQKKRVEQINNGTVSVPGTSSPSSSDGSPK
jgi:hypothetical protein